MTYYGSQLAQIHHEQYGAYAETVSSGVLNRVRDHVSIVELGAGSGALTRHLLQAGHRVRATDASPAMVALAREQVPEASPEVLVLPDDPIPQADAIVAVGHVFNYLDDKAEVQRALDSAARALTPGGLVLTDVLDLAYGDTRREPTEHVQSGDGWRLTTRLSLESPTHFRRQMTIETRHDEVEEVHDNVLVDVASLADKLRLAGFAAKITDAFGSETLPEGFLVLELSRP